MKEALKRHSPESRHIDLLVSPHPRVFKKVCWVELSMELGTLGFMKKQVKATWPCSNATKLINVSLAYHYFGPVPTSIFWARLKHWWKFIWSSIFYDIIKTLKPPFFFDVLVCSVLLSSEKTNCFDAFNVALLLLPLFGLFYIFNASFQGPFCCCSCWFKRAQFWGKYINFVLMKNLGLISLSCSSTSSKKVLAQCASKSLRASKYLLYSTWGLRRL